jgi:hypothetical protein
MATVWPLIGMKPATYTSDLMSNADASTLVISAPP